MDRSGNPGYPLQLGAHRVSDYARQWLRERLGGLRADPARLRQHIGGAAAASAAGIYLTSPSLAGPLFPLAVALFWLSVPFLGASRPDKTLLTLFTLIIASAWLSVGHAAFFSGNLPGSLWLAILTSVLAPLAWIRDPMPIFQWMVPAWLAQAGIGLYQWIFTETSRVNGIAENANAGSAFLLLGCIYLLNGNTRAKWLILPMVMAMPSSGSRWVGVVAAVVLLALFGGRFINWRYIAVGIAVALAVSLISNYERLWDAYIDSHYSGDPWKDAQVRFSKADSKQGLSLIPLGFWDSPIHNVPWRMMHETGVLSGLAWAAATLYGLWRRPLYDTRWWLLLTVGLLSLMYYHTWIGPLGWAWWLLLGWARAKKPGTP